MYFIVSETSRNCADREDHPTDGCSHENSTCTCVCGWELCNDAPMAEAIANCTRDSQEVKDDGATMTSSHGHVIVTVALIISVVIGYLL